MAPAAAARAAAPVMMPRARPAAAPVAPPGGPGPSGGSPAQVAREQQKPRARRNHAIPRLRIGRHNAPPGALDRLQLGGTFGLRLGMDSNGLPVTITLFHPDPWSVMLVGGMWAAKLLAFRALRFGARVVVRADNAIGWSELGQVATGRTDRVVLVAPGVPVGVTASADTPVLFLWDADAQPAASEAAAWQTRLTLVRRLTPERIATVPRADLVMTQRLAPSESSALAPALRLAPQAAQRLSMLEKDMLAVLTRAQHQYVWLSGDDPVEREKLGRPGRH